MKKLTLALAAAVSVWAGPAAAQAPPAENAALRQQIERRFEVLLLTDRLVLRPRSAGSSVRIVELAESTIAIDGQPATGAEVRGKLGADADAVLRLSYLDMAQRRALFGGAVPVAPSVPTLPAPPAASEPPIQPAPPPPIEPREPRRTRRGDQVRFGGNVRVDEDEVVVGDVVAIGGSARIDGEVRGEVVAVGGNVELGPRSLVTEDIAVVGGTARTRRRGPGAGGLARGQHRRHRFRRLALGPVASGPDARTRAHARVDVDAWTSRDPVRARRARHAARP